MEEFQGDVVGDLVMSDDDENDAIEPKKKKAYAVTLSLDSLPSLSLPSLSLPSLSLPSLSLPSLSLPFSLLSLSPFSPFSPFFAIFL
jgi:hypothetical protein